MELKNYHQNVNDQDFFYFTGGALDKGGRWTKGFTVFIFNYAEIQNINGLDLELFKEWSELVIKKLASAKFRIPNIF